MSVFISRLGCFGIAIGTSSARAFIRVSVSGIAASSFTPHSLSVVSLLLLYSPSLYPAFFAAQSSLVLVFWHASNWRFEFHVIDRRFSFVAPPRVPLLAISIRHPSLIYSPSLSLSTGCRILLVRLPRQHSMQAENVQTVKCQKAKCECHRELCEGTRSHDHGQVHTRRWRWSRRGC